MNEDAERWKLRQGLLRNELEGEGFNLSDLLPDSLGPHREAIAHLAIEEIAYALYISPHEGIRPPYGCLISVREPEPNDAATAVSDERQLMDARRLADGREIILWRTIEGLLFTHDARLIDELSAIRFVQTVDGILVTRLASGVIHVVSRMGVLTCDYREWKLRPSATKTLSRLAVSEFRLPTDGLTFASLLSLLELCCHRLSPLGIGATFVVPLHGSADGIVEALKDNGRSPVVELNAFDAGSQIQIRNLLAMSDGACIVAQDGSLLRYEAKLTFSETSVAHVQQHGGTRHTSAKRFTYDNEHVIAVVVSADGPVTMFSDGCKLASFDTFRASHKWLLNNSYSQSVGLSETQERLNCNQCGKHILLTSVRGPGGGLFEFACPVCNRPISRGDDIVSGRLRPYKPWEESTALTSFAFPDTD